MENKIQGVILAGGLARRMQGEDKGLILFKQKPLCLHCAERLRPQVARLAINANRNLERYQAFGFPVFCDELKGFQGPLSGMLSGLEQSLLPFVLFVPCDGPFLPLNLAQRLFQACQEKNALLAYACDEVRAHPTFCLMHRSLAPKLAQFLAQGERRLLKFMQENHALAVKFHDGQAFENFNTLADVEKKEN